MNIRFASLEFEETRIIPLDRSSVSILQVERKDLSIVTDIVHIMCDTQKDIDYFWDKLSEGGDPKAQQCGWLKDRYGVLANRSQRYGRDVPGRKVQGLPTSHGCHAQDKEDGYCRIETGAFSG
jgi:hypothetical protein